MLLEKRLSNSAKELPSTHQALLEELYGTAEEQQKANENSESSNVIMYTQQQLNRITGGAYLAKQQRLIQNA